MLYSYDRREAYSYGRQAKEKDLLAEWNLEGLRTGAPVMLYHGTTKLFRRFDLSKSREELVNNYYGIGIFLSPSKRVAMAYADANRNIGFDPSIIGDLRRRNPVAGDFLHRVFQEGPDAWDQAVKDYGFWNDNPGPGEGNIDWEGFQKYVGADPNTLSDIADYIIGSKTKPLGSGGDNPLFQSTGAPSWLYDNLDAVGLNSKVYRPKLYTVVATVSNPLVTKSKGAARKARSQGYDSVFYYGTDLVQGIPEVAVFSPPNVKIRRIEVLD